MADVKVNMDVGEIGLVGQPTPQPVPTKVRRTHKLPEALMAKHRDFETRKRALAEKRGAAKDVVDPKIIQETRAIVAEGRALKQEMAEAYAAIQEQQTAAKDEEIAKQKAAEKREMARRGDK